MRMVKTQALLSIAEGASLMGCIATMGIGFGANSFRSGVRAPLSLRAFCFAEGSQSRI
ncbi:hypothetical protein H5T88_02795 [bacterium]|nr:hypothetical protein [bacterium]